MSNFSEKYAKYTVQTLQDLIDNTEIGQFIGFYVPVLTTVGVWHTEKKTGFVKEKYSHTFMLDDGSVYQWKDYLLGKVF